jgi:hypothetical protein
MLKISVKGADPIGVIEWHVGEKFPRWFDIEFIPITKIEATGEELNYIMRQCGNIPYTFNRDPYTLEYWAKIQYWFGDTGQFIIASLMNDAGQE